MDTEQPNQNSRAHKPKLSYGRWLSLLLALAGLGWIGFLLHDQGAVLTAQLGAAHWGWLGLATLMGTLALAHDALIFYLLIEPANRQQVGWFAVARLFFVGQMVRHLPGRVWSVLYQVNAAHPALTPRLLVYVNLDFMLIGLAHSLIIPTALFLYAASYGWLAGLVVIGGLGVVGGLLHYPWLKHLPAFLPARLAPYSAAFADRPRRPWRDIGRILGVVLSYWGGYLVAWQLLGWGLPQLADANLILLCAAYTVAWAVGFVSLLTPAGLGVREASFLAVGANLTTPTNLAFLALFVRVWLLVIDLILFLCCVLGGWRRPQPSRQIEAVQ